MAVFSSTLDALLEQPRCKDADFPQTDHHYVKEELVGQLFGLRGPLYQVVGGRIARVLWLAGAEPMLRAYIGGGYANSAGQWWFSDRSGRIAPLAARPKIKDVQAILHRGREVFLEVDRTFVYAKVPAKL